MSSLFPVLAILAALPARPAFSQTTVVGDAYILGSFGVGVSTPSARVQVVASSAESTVFQVSGVDETPFLTVSSSGAVGLGVAPATQLDINGSGDSGAIGLQLRNGSLYPAGSAYQMAFGVNGTADLLHAIRTEHSTTTANNSIDFFLWTPSVSTTSVGSLEALSIVTTSTEASFHVLPAGTPTVEAVVSNGSTLGGGTVIRAVEAVQSSRALKSGISYLGQDAEEQAYQDVKALKHVTFRYKVMRKGKLVRDKKQQVRRGLLYEESPASIRGPSGTLVVDERINNAELAMKALMRRLESAKVEAGGLGGGRQP